MLEAPLLPGGMPPHLSALHLETSGRHHHHLQSQEVGGEVVMDRMKKILSSPITKKRALSSSSSSNNGNKYFGVPLEEIVKREGSAVPFLVQKICHYIQTSGLGCEGIFRVNGNSRVVERLRTSFDRTGDADLAEAGDMMAVAGLLKLYLRELPNGVIPDNMTQLFVAAQLETKSDVGECIARLKVLLRKLPKPAYDLLKYLARFLAIVAQNEEHNKMNPVALGIVFGPNLFSERSSDPSRCSGGIEGLRQQGVTNQSVLHFITQYDALFLEPGEISPYSATTTQVIELSKTRTPPPRPPPPQRDGASSPPVPSPRKMRSRVSELQDSDDIEVGGEDSPRTGRTPRLSDEEYLDTYRSASPFVLDSDRSESSAMTSPMASISTEAVEKAISHAVSRHMFGEMSSDDETTSDAPIPAPRKKRRERGNGDMISPTDKSVDGEQSVEQLSVKARVERLEDDSPTSNSAPQDVSKPTRNRPKSKAFEVFESSGLIISPASELPITKQATAEDKGDDSDTLDGQDSPVEPAPRPLPKPRTFNKQRELKGDGSSTSQDSLTNLDSDDSGFSSIQRSSSTLTSFKRAPGPKNRRTPSRRSLRLPQTGEEAEDNQEEEDEDDEDDDDDIQQEVRRPNQLANGNVHPQDENHNAPAKPSINFLNIHLNGSREERTSPDRSPTSSRKPYVPPLDLSILHEHGDGSDPIPADQGPSMALHKAKILQEEDSIMMSPRTSKIKKKSRIEDSQTIQVKQFTKKIQSCKRKIKLFEEQFEDERGYRPSQTDKAANPEIKKTMQDLARARKEFRRLKEEIENFEHFAGDMTMGQTEVFALPKDTFPEDGPPRMEDTLDVLLKRLDEKRRDAARPEDLTLMLKEQVTEEKLAVQKALLQYENLHGRPTTKYEKELMKPLYDRYRQIKRILSKPASPRERGKPLESVPEDHTVEFNASPVSSSKTTDREIVRVPTGLMEEPEPSHTDRDFLVTRDFRLLKETLQPTTESPTKTTDLSPEGQVGWNPSDSPLHELSMKSMLEEQQKARSEKKRLRRVLREFEEEFLRTTGRKVQKDDRAPMDTEYYEYKQVKAKLKLLEALLSKHDKTGSL